MRNLGRDYDYTLAIYAGLVLTALSTLGLFLSAFIWHLVGKPEGLIVLFILMVSQMVIFAAPFFWTIRNMRKEQQENSESLHYENE